MSLEVMGRLDHLVEAVYDRFKDRYYPNESELLLSSGTFAPGRQLFNHFLSRGIH